MQEIPLYWFRMTKEWKCVEKPWGYHGELSPLGNPSAKNPRGLRPSGFGLGTSGHPGWPVWPICQTHNSPNMAQIGPKICQNRQKIAYWPCNTAWWAYFELDRVEQGGTRLEHNMGICLEQRSVHLLRTENKPLVTTMGHFHKGIPLISMVIRIQ